MLNATHDILALVRLAGVTLDGHSLSVLAFDNILVGPASIKTLPSLAVKTTGSPVLGPSSLYTALVCLLWVVDVSAPYLLGRHHLLHDSTRVILLF